MLMEDGGGTGTPTSPEAKLGMQVEDLWDIQEPQLSPTEKLNACFESIPVSDFPPADPSQVIEINSDSSLAEVVRLLAEHKVLSAPVVDVEAPEDASWIDRYIGMIEFAGIVVWILHQSEKMEASDGSNAEAVKDSEDPFGRAVAAASSGMSSPRYRSLHPESPTATSGNFFETLTSSSFYKNTTVRDISGSFRWAPFLALQKSNSFLTMLLLLSKYRMKSVPVVDVGEQKIDNIITQSAVIHMLEECAGLHWFESWGSKKLYELGLPLMNANHIIKVYEDEPVLQAFKLMRLKSVGGVPVVERGGRKAVGNISIRILLEAVVGAAGLARSWSSYFASIISSNPDKLRIKIDSFAEGFNLLDPLAVGVLALCNGIAMSGTRKTSILTWISSIISSLVIIFIIIIGFIHGKSSNLEPFLPFGVKGIFTAAAVVYWSYTGFDMVATMAEETKKPSRDIPIGLVGSMFMITIIYCLMAFSLTYMVKYTDVDVNAAYSVAFERIGMKWAKYLVSICALKGMTTSMLVGSMGQSRYTTQIARAHMIPPWFALVHPKTGTPIYATLLVTIISCIVTLFSSLDVLSSVLSFSTLFIFILVAVALLFRRYYVQATTPKGDFIKFLATLTIIIGSSIGLSIFWSSGRAGWVGYAVCSVIWLVGTLLMALLPKQRAPKVWGVPLVPLLPSLSIGMNIFLIGSLGALAFWRFIICSGVMVIYYLLVGVHATYDMAHVKEQMGEDSNQNKNEVI